MPKRKVFASRVLDSPIPRDPLHVLRTSATSPAVWQRIAFPSDAYIYTGQERQFLKVTGRLHIYFMGPNFIPSTQRHRPNVNI